MTTLPSGISLPGGTSAPAAIRQRLPILAPSSTIAPLAIMLPSPTLQPCRKAMCPTVTSAPMRTGTPGSVWITLPSWMLLPRPISIQSVSPRITALNQTLAAASRRTLPITCADGAT